MAGKEPAARPAPAGGGGGGGGLRDFFIGLATGVVLALGVNSIQLTGVLLFSTYCVRLLLTNVKS